MSGDPLGAGHGDAVDRVVAPGDQRPSSLARDSSIRFAAEVVWAGCALVTGVVVARSLGPDGKGIAALLGYLVVIVGPLSALGLGDSGAAFIRQGRVALDDAVASSMAAVGIASVAGAVVLFGLAYAQFHAGGLYRELDTPILVAALTVPLVALTQMMTLFVESQWRLDITSLARIVSGLVTAVATALLVHAVRLGVTGAMIASGLGFGTSAGFLAAHLRRSRALRMPTIHTAYLRNAIRVGLPIQAAIVLVGLSARADMFVVQWFHGGSETGLYSVAITISQLVLFVPVALASASYPVIAGMTDAAFGTLVDRLARSVLVASTILGCAVAAASPIVVPLAFGSGFRPAVGTTILLLPATVPSALQWMLTRAIAARGHGGPVLRSYAIATGVMLVADLALVPAHGRTGAAAAATIGSIVGLAIALRGYRSINPVPRLLHRTFVPRRGDLRVGRSMLVRSNASADDETRT